MPKITSAKPFAHHVLAAAALTALHLGAQAQTAGQLQVVTVTAERRLENIRDVPSSVSALQGDILDVLGTSGQDVRALSGRVPSLNIESSFGRAFPRFYIRGYGKCCSPTSPPRSSTTCSTRCAGRSSSSPTPWTCG